MADTEIQKKANVIDLELFNLARSLDRLEGMTRDGEIGKMACRAEGMRPAVRKHMSEEDRESTKRGWD